MTVTPTPTATPSPSATASSAPIAIDKASGFDPQGDDKERNSEAARVFDGDKGTSWTSEGYATPSFGGLKKGVGVLLDLGQPTQVTKAVLELGSKNLDVTVYAAPDGTLDGATEIGVQERCHRHGDADRPQGPAQDRLRHRLVHQPGARRRPRSAPASTRSRSS